MSVSGLADADDAIAFGVFYRMVGPALRRRALRPMQVVFHAGARCPAGPGRLCAECAETVDDLLLESFERLRTVLAGQVRRTRAGEPIREWAQVAEHVLSVAATGEDETEVGARLLTGLGEGPHWVRAAWGQLVYQPTRMLTERLVRARAQAAGASARPDRDLRTAAWAAPLRVDDAAELLVVFLARLRRGAGDPYQLPDNVLVRHGLDEPTGRARLRDALRRLRRLRPDFAAANVDGLLPPEPSFAEVPGPETVVLAWDETLRARQRVRSVLDDGVWRRRLSTMVRLAEGDRAAARARWQSSPSDAPSDEAAMLRECAALVAAAGLDWTRQVLGSALNGVPARRAVRRPAAGPDR